MTDYKATLNLPETGFPMKAGLAQQEPKRLDDWKAKELYQKIRQQAAAMVSLYIADWQLLFAEENAAASRQCRD